MPRQHALYVAVEDGVALAEREREYRARRGPADARQLRDRLDIRRKTAAVLVADDLRRAVQVARAGVVAEPGPVLQYLVESRVGESDARPGSAR